MKSQSLFSILRSTCLCFLLVLLGACENSVLVVSAVEEREANEIIVFLASNGIPSSKSKAAASGIGTQGGVKWDIFVAQPKSTDAMAILNQNGLPRIKGTNLLDLFGSPGMMSTEKEGNIRYQAGLAEQIAGTIRKIDGVLDADVQISFSGTDPGANALPWMQSTAPKITAAVYVKHQGVLDDPNSHLIMKIKRLVAGSVQGLEINDVTVISDRARFADITLNQTPTSLAQQQKDKEYVSIWSIVMSKGSAGKFRMLFFFLSLFVVLLGTITGWLLWKVYPIFQSRGWKQILRPEPLDRQAPPPPTSTETQPKETP